jgi:hypothetical protein
MAEYVLFGCGSQLAELVRPERKHGTDGYLVIPMASGTADGKGVPKWVSRVTMPCMDLWRYDPLRNTWTRHLPRCTSGDRPGRPYTCWRACGRARGAPSIRPRRRGCPVRAVPRGGSRPAGCSGERWLAVRLLRVRAAGAYARGLGPGGALRAKGRSRLAAVAGSGPSGGGGVLGRS